MNAEFQRIARRDKKAFFSGNCNEIKENNRMGKTRDLWEWESLSSEKFVIPGSISCKNIFHANVFYAKKKKRQK